MNLVFVNHMHPATPHVSGMRAWYFARELAKRGHRVIQICEWRKGTEVAPTPEHLAELLQTHDWAEPLLLAIRPKERRLLNLVRSAQTPAMLRKALVSWSYLRHSGVFTDFSEGVKPYLPVLAKEFQPQATWGLFGNTDCWLIAQRLAHLGDCSWLADMKDSWEVFIRRPLRAILAQRFQDMAACTANAEFNAGVLQRWFTPKPTLVYSGVDPCFFSKAPLARAPDTFRITITGSVHNLDLLAQLVEAIRAWFTSARGPGRSGVAKLEVIYAGASSKQVGPVLRSLSPLAKVTVQRYLPLSELAALCQSASVNTYIWNSKTFHHKLLELLTCSRPVIAFPGETEESKRLAEACEGQLETPLDQAELMVVLNKVAWMARSDQLEKRIRQQDYSWAGQAKHLERVLMQACEGTKS